MATLNQFKRGDTFGLTCTYKNGGVPASLDTISIRSQLRNGDALVCNFTANKADQATNPGVFTLSPAAPNNDTSAWPTGLLVCDIEFTEGGTVRSTETFSIPVIDEVTK